MEVKQQGTEAKLAEQRARVQLAEAECQGGGVSQGGAREQGAWAEPEDHHGRADRAKNHQCGAEDNQSRAKDPMAKTGGANTTRVELMVLDTTRRIKLKK